MLLQEVQVEVPGRPLAEHLRGGPELLLPELVGALQVAECRLRQISTEYIAPTCVSEKGAMSGPAHESMALVIVLPGSPVSHMLAKVGEQLRKIV